MVHNSEKMFNSELHRLQIMLPELRKKASKSAFCKTDTLFCNLGYMVRK